MGENRKYFKPAVISYIFLFFFLITILVLFFGLMIPISINLNTAILNAGQMVMNQADIQGIQDASVRAEVNNSIVTARSSLVEQISIMAFLVQYGWIIILALVTLILFIASRRDVEARIGIG